MAFRRIILIVLDSVGIGAAPDAEKFGDIGAHTLGHIAERVPGFRLPNLARMGLGNIAPLAHVPPSAAPEACYGRMAEVSAGKDTMTGHWEIAGLRIDIPFRTYPEGFPAELLAKLSERTGRGVLGNKPASGTAIIRELGEEQMRTGSWIVYTSADSVLQIAAHEEVIPLEELYRGCAVARELTLDGPWPVGRIIARPYIGRPGRFERTAHRHDYAVKPPRSTVLNQLNEAGLDVLAVGKIHDIFSGEGIAKSLPTTGNDDGITNTAEAMAQDFHGLLFVNLVDFDSLYGHRRDPIGYGEALMRFDDRLPEIVGAMRPDDLLMLTADHGNDPIHAGTDHTREYVPLLAYRPSREQPGCDLGIRSTYADLGATIADNFGMEGTGFGKSFLRLL